MKRLVVLVIASVFVVALSGPAFATESHSEDEETTATTVPAEPEFADGEPAIVIPPAEETVEEQPWTSRYLYPLIVIGTAVLLVGLVIGYNHSIRHRYKVVA
ncbi:MAG: hypothetical protein ACR2N7_06105 [Acidimicrobiia bacterium]